jgi:hypothetical protein
MNSISILAARSLTEVLVSLAINAFYVILWFCIGMVFLFGLIMQLIKIYDWLFSKDGKELEPASLPAGLIIVWWGFFVVLPLLMWFKYN